MVLLGIGVTGLYSMSVVQTRQTARLTEIIEDGVDQAVNPSTSTWAQKLGAYAEVDAMDDVGDVPGNRPAVLPRIQTVGSRDDASGYGAFKSDNGDPSEWTIESSTDAYQGTCHKQLASHNGWFQFYIDGLVPGRYEVFTTYPPSPNAGSVVRYWVYADKGWENPPLVDQRVLVSDLVHDGQDWQRLGIYNTDDSRLWIHQSNWSIGGDFMLADAVLVRNAETMRVVSVTATASGGYTAVLEDTP